MANPMYGQNAADNASDDLSDHIKIKSYKVTATTATVATHVLDGFSKGDMILGIQVKVTTAVTSDGSATVLFGFTGGTHVTSAIAKGTLVDDYVTGSADKGAAVLAADDNFDITVGTDALTAGAFDIRVVYIPAPNMTDGNDTPYQNVAIG